jgi:hypothetical protein
MPFWEIFGEEECCAQRAGLREQLVLLRRGAKQNESRKYQTKTRNRAAAMRETSDG